MATARIVIVGGGTAGIAVASRLAKKLPSGSIFLIEPSSDHYYQPLFTLVGAGAASLASTRRDTRSLIPSGVEWVKERAEAIDPERREVRTAGRVLSYDYLVVCPGIHIEWDQIAGLEEAIGKGGVCSNYSERYVDYTWETIRNFKGGNAVFTFPSTPVKCAGAPQKIMYLAEDYWRRHGLRRQAKVIFASAGAKIFGVQKYADALSQIIKDRDIETRFNQNLVAIDGGQKVATFRDGASGQEIKVPYEMIHVTPPMRAPDLVVKSALASAAGWVDIDKGTLQHVRYPTVFALGDASSLPTSRTGAAIRAQAPVLVANLLSHMQGQPLARTYDGYTSCPLVTGYGRLILAEFDYDGKPKETFPFDQGKERLSMYLLKKYILPQLYWHGMMRGRA